jgi:hypothetical protein
MPVRTNERNRLPGFSGWLQVLGEQKTGMGHFHSLKYRALASGLHPAQLNSAKGDVLWPERKRSSRWFGLQ